MASIRIHQDIFNFERRRKGFTSRQIVGLLLSLAVCAGITALLGYAVRIPPTIAVSLGLVAAMPFAYAGFVPIWGMPAEEAFSRFLDLSERGNAIRFEGEYVEPMKGVTTRAFRKKAKKKGFECR